MMVSMKKLLSEFFRVVTILIIVICALGMVPFTKDSRLYQWTKAHIGKKDISLKYKVYTLDEVKKFFRTNLIKKGFLPVFISIQNDSDLEVHFSPDQMNVPHASAKKISKLAHKSFIGKMLAYNIASFFFMPISIIGTVDGIRHWQANRTIDKIYAAREAVEQWISPHETYRGVIFIPLKQLKERLNNLTVTLTDLESKEALEIVGKPAESDA